MPTWSDIGPTTCVTWVNFHEKISNFQSSFFSQFRCEIQLLFMRFHKLSWKISNFQSSFFSQFRFEIQVLFMRFHKFSWNISNFQSSPFYKFRCEIQVFVMCFHEFSWKNIKLSKLVLFSVQMWDSSIFHALSLFFM